MSTKAITKPFADVPPPSRATYLQDAYMLRYCSGLREFKPDSTAPSLSSFAA
jgi:hypothetical protein